MIKIVTASLNFAEIKRESSLYGEFYIIKTIYDERGVLILRIAVAADHGGFQLKKEVIECLRDDGFEYKDFGTYSEESVDYPDLALAVAEAVKAGEFDRGILCCGTGIGVSLAANKVPGIRAAVCHDTFSARYAQEHNDANILTMGQRVIGSGLAIEIVRVWLSAVFAGGRHARRVEKIAQIEAKYNK